MYSIAMMIYNDTEEDLIIKSEGYVTTDGLNYDAMMNNDTEDKLTIEAGDNSYMRYQTADYLTNGTQCEIWKFPIKEDSTFTLYFTLGGQEYQAVINLSDGTYNTFLVE